MLTLFYDPFFSFLWSMSEVDCKEFFLDNIAYVFVLRSSDVRCDKPCNVFAAHASVATDGSPLLVAGIASGEGRLCLADVPTLKISSGRQAAGFVYSHELTLPFNDGRAMAEAFVANAQALDLDIVYVMADGSMNMSRSLPNSSSCALEENHASNSSASVKLSVQSMSPLVDVSA